MEGKPCAVELVVVDPDAREPPLIHYLPGHSPARSLPWERGSAGCGCSRQGGRGEAVHCWRLQEKAAGMSVTTRLMRERER